MDPIVKSFITKHLNELPTHTSKFYIKLQISTVSGKKYENPWKQMWKRNNDWLKTKKAVFPQPGLLLPSELNTSPGPTPSPWVLQAAWLFTFCMPGVKCVPFVSTLRKAVAPASFSFIYFILFHNRDYTIHYGMCSHVHMFSITITIYPRLCLFKEKKLVLAHSAGLASGDYICRWPSCHKGSQQEAENM